MTLGNKEQKQTSQDDRNCIKTDFFFMFLFKLLRHYLVFEDPNFQKD